MRDLNQVDQDPVKLLIMYEDQLRNIQLKLNGNHMSLVKRIKLEKRAERLSRELIPRVRKALNAIAEAAQKFQRV